MNVSIALLAVLKALHFAADKHRDQRRKGAEASPYVNHLIEVAELLTREGGMTDVMTLGGVLKQLIRLDSLVLGFLEQT